MKVAPSVKKMCDKCKVIKRKSIVRVKPKTQTKTRIIKWQGLQVLTFLRKKDLSLL